LLNALTVNHDARLAIDTSFTGQDLFRVLLRSGNFGPSGFFSNPPTPLSQLDFAVEEPLCRVEDATCSRNLVSVNRAYVPIPLGPEIRLSAGSRLVQLDLLPVWPSLANDSPILDLFQRAGAAGAYSRRLGSGFGAWWQPEGRLRGLSIAYAAVAPQADNGSPGEGGAVHGRRRPDEHGAGAYTRPTWNFSAAYTRNGQHALLRGTPLASQLAANCRDGALHSWSRAGLSGVRTTSWSVGLNWSDLFSAGNSLTPAVFWLSRPRGAMVATTSLNEALRPGREAAASLGAFLAMSLMTIQFWTLVNLAGPLLLILIAQFPLALLINLVLVFPLLGGTDDAAVIAAGFSGFSLGSTPTAMANMTAVTQRFGPSAKALIVLPLVSALFMDLLNAVLIPLFLPRL
jgi:hypothetical protein